MNTFGVTPICLINSVNERDLDRLNSRVVSERFQFKHFLRTFLCSTSFPGHKFCKKKKIPIMKSRIALKTLGVLNMLSFKNFVYTGFSKVFPMFKVWVVLSRNRKTNFVILTLLFVMLLFVVCCCWICCCCYIIFTHSQYFVVFVSPCV